MDLRCRGGMLMIRRVVVAAGDPLKSMRDCLGRPIAREGDARIDGREDLLDEGIEVVSQEYPQ